MPNPMQTQLEAAKAAFYAWRLHDVYRILRRFFDRLPFEFQESHVEYLGYFTRTLGELGKQSEAAFYLQELEKIYEKTRNAEAAYALVVFYVFYGSTKPEILYGLINYILSKNEAQYLHNKTKVYLAIYYDKFAKDSISAKNVIYSIQETEDINLIKIVEIWKGKVLMDTGDYQASETILLNLLQDAYVKADWYLDFSTKLMYAGLLLRTQRKEQALSIHAELKAIFEQKGFKRALSHLQSLEKEIEECDRIGKVTCTQNEESLTVTYKNKKIRFTKKSPNGILMTHLAKKGAIKKQDILSAIYGKKAIENSEEKKAYYHIFNLRKKLSEIDLPGTVITSEPTGYYWQTEIEFKEEEL